MFRRLLTRIGVWLVEHGRPLDTDLDEVEEVEDTELEFVHDAPQAPMGNIMPMPAGAQPDHISLRDINNTITTVNSGISARQNQNHLSISNDIRILSNEILSLENTVIGRLDAISNRLNVLQPPSGQPMVATPVHAAPPRAIIDSVHGMVYGAPTVSSRPYRPITPMPFEPAIVEQPADPIGRTVINARRTAEVMTQIEDAMRASQLREIQHENVILNIPTPTRPEDEGDRNMEPGI